MTPEAVARELAAGRLRPAYLLAGSEALQRDDLLVAIRAAALASGPADFNFDRLDGDAATPAALLDSVRTLPVMAPHRLVVLREPAGRRGGSRTLLDTLAEVVAELCSTPHVTTLLVVTAAQLERRARWVKAFCDPALVVECEAPRSGREITAFVRKETARQGVNLERGAAELLAERIGPQLLLLRQEIAKAALLAGAGERVRREHVAVSTSAVAEEPIWELTDAIGEGRSGDALTVLTHLLAGGVPPPVVLGSLASHFRRLARTREGGRVAGPRFVLRKLESQARRYAPQRLAVCLEAIYTADEMLKGRGGVAPQIALERLVLGLAS